MGMSRHDAYYEPQDDNSDLLDDRIAELMKSDYDPTEYAHFAEAISEAKKLNLQPNQIHKLVAYKCTYCNKYHVGRSKKEIDEKYRNKILNQQWLK